MTAVATERSKLLAVGIMDCRGGGVVMIVYFSKQAMYRNSSARALDDNCWRMACA
jgi:hypothetical protein